MFGFENIRFRKFYKITVLTTFSFDSILNYIHLCNILKHCVSYLEAVWSVQRRKQSQKWTLNSSTVVPLFEQFLLLFQKSSPTIHILYDSVCDVLAKLMRRFMKMAALEKKYGSELASIECKDVSLQLADKDVVIGDRARKGLDELPRDQKEVGRGKTKVGMKKEKEERNWKGNKRVIRNWCKVVASESN